MENTIVVNKVSKRRYQTLGEEIGNSVTHGCGAIFAIVALILMIVFADNSYELAGGLVFGIGLFLVYFSSCMYHAFKRDTKVKKLFRIFDHSCIYIQIVGTYTPILLCVIGGVVGWVYFGIQWGIVITAIVCRVLFPTKTTVLNVVLSLLLGWSGITLLPMMYEYSKTFMLLILYGGIAYSVGIGFFIARFKYSHFVWHFFVIFGTVLHFIAIFSYIFV